MTALRKSNKHGFAYVVAIAILALMAFMGIFLMQSSSAEYSQTSLSVFRTMARQLAEAAAEEAAVMLEKQFKDKSKDGFFQQLIWQAATSGPMRTGGETGKNPSLLDDFKDLNNYVGQTLILRDTFVTRAGFEIEKVLPTIKDLRPIPQGPLDFDTCYYTPKDRSKPFDSSFSKDWYCTLQIEVTVSLKKQRKMSINYKLSKDIKIVNVGPIARNYTYYSILGPFIADYNDQAGVMSSLEKYLNAEGGPNEMGRLILWNIPFQSRIFMHGPAIIALENPNRGDMPGEGAYNNPPNNVGPGSNMAFQYSNTFYGFSYFPDEYRALFKNHKSLKDIWAKKIDTVSDSDTLQNNYRASGISHETALDGGIYPEKDSGFIKRFEKLFEQGWKDTYYIGKNKHQIFLPAGPFCRFPWRYVGGKVREKSLFAPNQLDPPPCEFPEDDPNIRIEHRWKTTDSDYAEKTKIYAEVNKVKYRSAFNSVDSDVTYPEFSLNYYNNEVIDGFFSKLWASVGSIGGSILNANSLGFQALFDGISSLASHFFKKDDTKEVDEEKEFENLFPTNFKFNYMGVVTRRFENEDALADAIADKDTGIWKLNGIYWLNSFNLEGPITYEGTGTIIVCRNTPMTIKGHIKCKRTNDDIPQGSLTIFYHPVDGSLNSDLATNKAYKRMIKLESSEGSGICIDASVYSLCGVWCKTGENISLNDCENTGFDPKRPLHEWLGDKENAIKISDTLRKVNLIRGNYVNYYSFIPSVCGSDYNNDLWVMHNDSNPLFTHRDGNEVTLIQEYLDTDETARLNYEYLTHEFFMSPKIQHIGIKGAL